MIAASGDGQTRSLGRGAALITLATVISRITGFVRVVVVAAAMGTTYLANTYQTANTAPNLIFELVAAGVLTSVFVPTFVDYLVRQKRDEGWQAADALASVGLAALIGIALVVALAAVPIMRLLTLGVEDPELRGREVELGARLLRLFAPQIVFYGAGMIMTSALHAHRRFAMPALAPIFNNVVVIAVYLAYAAMRGDRRPTVAGITDGEVLLLGLGTTAGVVAMTVCLIPQLRRLGWRFRPRWQPTHPAVKKGARLGAWALGYAGGYQAGLVVVLALANKVEGGVAAYQWAYTFFYLPHAVFAVPIFSVLFTAMSEKASIRDSAGVAENLRQGLGMLAFILIPMAIALWVMAVPVAAMVLDHGAMGRSDSVLVGEVLAMFVLGLPAYSVFLILTRTFYALGETRLPAIINAGAVTIASIAGAWLFSIAPEQTSVQMLALGHTLGFSLGALWLGRSLARHIGAFGSTALTASVVRSISVALVVGVVMLVSRNILISSEEPGVAWQVAAIGMLGAALYLALMTALRAPEIGRLRALVSGPR